MKVRVVFIGKKFSLKDKKCLYFFILKTAKKAVKILKIENKDIYFTIYCFKGQKINSGFTKAKDWVEITLPTGKLDYSDLEGVIFHELHHIARGYCGMLEKGKHVLLNSVFSEGLATAFETEQFPSRLAEHSKYNYSLIKTWLPRISKEFSSTNYDHAEWFWGKGKPKQLGYKIGKYLVDEIIKRNPSKTPANLARVEADKLLKMSGIKI
jgi:uncharacterized protein YjaZ